MAITDLPEVDFIESDVTEIKNRFILLYEDKAQRKLSKADPLQFVFDVIAYEFSQLMLLSEREAKAVLLKYSIGATLDNMAAMSGVTRLPADFALTTLLFTLSIPLDYVYVIPQGTRVGTEEGDGTVYFQTIESVSIPAGSLTATIDAECNVAGIVGNGFISGQIDTLIDPLPFVQTVANTTTSQGGANIESDEALRERVFLAPESFSVAGPSGAYEFFAKSASSSISDVSVSSPAPVEVLVTILLNGGVIPGQTIIDTVYNYLDDKKRRPLTDKVTVQAPTASNYNIQATYYISNSNMTNYQSIQSDVNQALNSFVSWQRDKLGRDINPTELIARLRNAGALRTVVTSPVFTELSDTQIAQEGTVNLTFGGFENG